MRRLATTMFTILLTAGLLFPVLGHADPVLTPPDSTDGIVLFGDDDEDDADDNSETEAAQEEDDGPSLEASVGGSLRFNALFRSYGGDFDQQSDRILGGGGFTFDTFRINASGSYGNLTFDTEYAIYPESFGGLFIHHGWIGYEFTEAFQTQVGVSQVPFGIQSYASSSWFFNSTYYVGLEDDYDAGIKAMYQTGPWDVQAAYYLNAEQTDFIGGQTFSRYSYDVAPITGFESYEVVPGGNASRSPISEENQFNLKVAYSVDHGDLGFSKVGVSGQRGQLLNQNNGDRDSHFAYAIHYQGRYEGFEAKLQFAQQELNPPLTEAEKTEFANNAGVDFSADDFVVMGAYGTPQRVASEHTVYSSSLAYHIPVDFGPVSEVKPYYDFSLVTKEVDSWDDNITHNVGFLTSAGPLFVYTDLNYSKGHPFNYSADNFASVLAEQNDPEWRLAFNVNIGLYF